MNRPLGLSGVLLVALFRAGGVEFLGLFESIAVGLDVDHLSAVDQAIDECDHAGCVREYFAPFGEALVGAEQKRFAEVVATRDDLEQQISVATVVREISDLVDAEQLRDGVSAAAALALGRTPGRTTPRAYRWQSRSGRNDHG